MSNVRAQVRTSRDAIHEVVKLGLVPLMKEHGFKKSALSFARRRGPLAHFLNVQLSQWNRGTAGQFYLNAGVMFDDICLLRDRKPPALPKYDDCQFLVRLERLNHELPAAVTVDETTNVEALAAWLARTVEETFILPLNAVKSANDFAQTSWPAAIPWSFTAVLQYVLGNLAEARRLVQLQADAFADRGCTFESVASSLHLKF
jgi:hypothetical protein